MLTGTIAKTGMMTIRICGVYKNDVHVHICVCRDVSLKTYVSSNRPCKRQGHKHTSDAKG